MSNVYRVLALFAILAMLVAGCAAPAPTPASAPAAEKPAAEAPAAEAPAAEAPAAEAPAAEAPAAAAGGEFHGAYPYQVPPTGHLNSFVSAGIPNGLGPYWDMLELVGARYYWADGTWMPLAAASWEFQLPDKFVVKVAQGIKWSDGTDVTAKDYVTTFNVLRLFKHTIYKYVDSVTAADDYTVEFHMSTPSTVVERYVLNEHVRATSTYGAIADEVQALVDAGKTEGDEWSALVQKATDFRPDTLIVDGPFSLDVPNITEAQLSLLKNPDSYLAGVIKFDKIVIYNGETPTVTPLVLAGDVDYATHGFPMATEQQYKDMGLRITRAPTYSGPALFFNHDVAPFDKVEFRQAVAFAIDRGQNGFVSLGESGKAMKYITGFSDLLLPLWLDDAQTAELTVYEYDAAKAEGLLESIGFKKGGDGLWQDDTGKTLDFELIFPAEFADWSAAAENLTEQLNNFGIKTTARGVNFQQITAEVNQGNFQIAIQGWGAANPHPYFGLQTVLFSRNYIAATEGKGINFPMTQVVDGAEVDLEAAIVKSAEGLDVEAQKADVAVVAKAFNELLPVIPLWERYGNSPFSEVRVTGIPDDSNKIWKNALYGDNPIVMMILDGTIHPK
ncbi:MAG: putative ABC transporter-binding protein precursor [Chloroflexi bacterium ADurb.Bin325]|nr:MAG: putative ABC transporter-binding protein precursor [Chloroflexi bacterium ADurb.Bin325]